VKPSSFEYHRPTSAVEAVGLLHELGEGAKVLAGGQSLVPMLSLRLAVFEHLVDVSRIEELRGIVRSNSALTDGPSVEGAVQRRW
jgi:aerobic carbon-monoxide dehydrogenase medium subunit